MGPKFNLGCERNSAFVNSSFSHQALQAHQSKFERDMLLHHQNLTPGDAEYQKLLNAHKAEMEALEQNLNSEKDRQREALRKKVRIP